MSDAVRRDAGLRGWGGARLLVVAGLPLLVGWFAFASFGLSGQAHLLRYPSGIFDMDVARVVHDWTLAEPALRASVHPLTKLAVAPVGSLLRRVGGLDPVDAARCIALTGMVIQTLLVARLASVLTGGAVVAGALAAGVFAASFATLLHAAIPESAALSGIGTLAPVAYVARSGTRNWGWREALGWIGLGLVCIAFTITQVVPWLICLALRARQLRQRGAARRRVALGLAAVWAAVAGLAVAGAELQTTLYPGTQRFYTGSPVSSAELHHLRTAELVGAPVDHVGRLVLHFAGVNFIAPMPGYSDFLMRFPGLAYWSLSLEEAGWERWHPLQWILFGVWALVLVPAALASGGLDRGFLAAWLCLAGQFGLHLFYGREYVLYSPNWHGLMAVVLVAAAWRGMASRRRWVGALTAGFSLALAFNSLAVMDRVYREVEAGLEREGRDARGALIGGRLPAGPFP